MLTVPHFPFISSGSLLSVLNTSKFAYFPNLSAGNSGVYLVGCASAAHVSSPGAFIKIFQMKTFSAPSRERAGSFPHSTVLILITGLQAVCTLYPIKKTSVPLEVVTIRRLQCSVWCSARDIFIYSLCSPADSVREPVFHTSFGTTMRPTYKRKQLFI